MSARDYFMKTVKCCKDARLQCLSKMNCEDDIVIGNPALPGVFTIKGNPLYLEFINQAKNIPVVLPSFPY